MMRWGALLAILILLLPGLARGQGAGPQTSFLTPVGLHSTAISYMEVDSNYRFGQTQIGTAQIDTNFGSFQYAYRFGLRERFAQFNVNVTYTDINAIGDVGLVDPFLAGSGLVTRVRSGFGDPRASLRVGLIGAPALTPEEWVDFKKDLQLYVEVGATAPWGLYEPAFALNPGFNRWAFDVSAPMVIPIDGARKKTFLEIKPQVYVYGTNDDAPRRAGTQDQDPLYLLEFHVSRLLGPKWWLALGAQYQYGGETITDGSADGNRIKQWFGEIGIGHVFNRHVGVVGEYGKIFGSDNNTRGDVWRLRVIFFY